MFGRSYFGGSYFGAAYFGDGGDIVSYTLVADVATFSLSAQASLGRITAPLGAASFALSGGAANLAQPVSVAAFSLSGQAISFTTNFPLAVGSYVLSAQSAQQLWAASVGSFTLTGVDAVLRTSIGLIASGATFTLSGWNTFREYNPSSGPAEGAVAEYAVAEFPGDNAFVLTAVGATFNLSGQPIVFRQTQVADRADFTLAGQAAEQAWPASAAAFTLVGQAALFRASLAISAGSFVLTGGTANLAWAADAAAFTLSGVDISYTLARNAETAAFILNGIDVHFTDLEVATFALGGQDAALQTTMAASLAEFTFSGIDVNFITARIMPADVGAFSLSGQDVGFGRGMGADLVAFILSGQAVNLTPHISAGVTTFTLSGQAALFNLAFGLTTGQFILRGVAIADALGPSGDHIFLVEVQAHDGADLLTFYLGTEGFLDGSNFYIPRVMDPGNFSQSISLPGEGEGAASAGDVVIANGDPGNGDTLDSWIPLGFGGRSIIIRALSLGSSDLSTSTTLFRGRVGKLRSTRPLDQLELTISNKLTDLDKPLLSDRFAGTTTSTGDSAEGNADLKDQIKQQCWGEVSQVPLQPANPYDLIYLVSNVTAHSQLVSITVYDGGLELTADGDEADVADLRAASISAGHYRTCLAEGLIRLGGTAEKTLTADVVEGTNPADRTAAQIALRQLLQFGVDSSDISNGSFDDLDNKNNAICYSFVNDERSAGEEIRAVLRSIGAHLLPNRNDLFEVTRFEAPVSSATLDFDINQDVISDTLQRLEGSPPSYQVVLEWGRVFHPQQESELAGAVTAEMRAYFSKDIRKSVQEDLTVKTKHLDAGIISFETRLAYQTDADDEAQRLLDLMSVERDEYSVELPLSDGWAAQVGGSITLRHDRLGLSAGKAFNVLTRSDQYVKETVSLDRVWG